MKKFKGTNERHFHDREELMELHGIEPGHALAMVTYYLLQLAAVIRQAQSPKDGSVQLFFTQCGKNCTGCPHTNWGIWRRHWRGAAPFHTRHAVKQIKRTARYKGRIGRLSKDFYGHRPSEATVDFATLRNCIDWSLILIDHRKALIQHLNSAKRRARAIKKLGSPFPGE